MEYCRLSASLPIVCSSLRVIRPSLGASGAVLACFAATAVYHPDASVALIFLPMIPFTIETGLKVAFSSPQTAVDKCKQDVPLGWACTNLACAHRTHGWCVLTRGKC